MVFEGTVRLFSGFPVYGVVNKNLNETIGPTLRK